MADLTHLDDEGRARMVDISGKPVTQREAIAEGWIVMSPDTLQAIQAGDVPKGNVLATARIAGIQAAKRTDQLIPLCHSLPLSSLTIDLAMTPRGIRAIATARTDAKTGVEMEALTAVSVALLTLYDMVKAIDRTMQIDGIRLIAKRGGKSGDWSAGPAG